MTSISFVILTFNSEDLVGRCIVSAEKMCSAEGIEHEIIVVDNGSTDRTREVVRGFRDVRLIAMCENGGTTRPRNAGVCASSGVIISFLDSDTEMLDGSLREIVNLLVERRDIGIVAPRLLYPDNRVQQSIKKFPLLHEKILKIPSLLLGRKPHSSEHYSALPADRPATVASAISACWFFRRDLVDEIGFLDENIFYSPEDLDYCLRCWKRGFSVLYYPRFRVRHHTQQITHRNPLGRIARSHLAGLFYFYRKHGYLFSRPVFGEWENP